MQSEKEREMKAILIDPETQSVTDIETDGTLKESYKLLGCTTVDGVVVDGNIMVFHHSLLVDGEGLFKGEDELKAHGPRTRWYYDIRRLDGKGNSLSSSGSQFYQTNILTV
jgi:hypothetical protein